MSASRLEQLSSWHSDWAGLRVAVLGLGSTGFAAADTLVELGCRVELFSSSGNEDLERILAVLKVPVVIDPLQEAPEQLLRLEPELIVVSPGFAPDHPVLGWAGERGIPIWGDVELAWRLRDKAGEPGEWILITGTNGKTTTTQLTEAMLLADGRRVLACGNIGIPVLDAVRDPIGYELLVVELSSFQLHWVQHLEPLASVCLNIADDHHDWHGGAEGYLAAKAKVYEHAKLACVYNRNDRKTEAMVEQADVAEGCRAIGFGLMPPGPSDLGIVESLLIDRAFHEDRHTSGYELAAIDELVPTGLVAPHLLQDVLAAAALARAAGAEVDSVRTALLNFELDAHRMQLVASFDGISWVNDSKATNPHAAAASLISYPSVVWVVGGLFKGVDVAPLIAGYAHRLRGAILIGAEREELRSAFARHAPELPVFEVETSETDQVMPTVVRLAASLARTGDTVLLAPAAASMDQFTNYAERGHRFTEAVAQHLGGASDGDDPAAGQLPER